MLKLFVGFCGNEFSGLRFLVLSLRFRKNTDSYYIDYIEHKVHLVMN